jgi:hypothetical protein
MSQTPKKTFLLRIDKNLYDAILKMAEEDCRSINSEIEFILKKAISEKATSSKATKIHAEKSITSDEKPEIKMAESKPADNKEFTNQNNWLSMDNFPD